PLESFKVVWVHTCALYPFNLVKNHPHEPVGVGSLSANHCKCIIGPRLIGETYPVSQPLLLDLAEEGRAPSKHELEQHIYRSLMHYQFPALLKTYVFPPYLQQRRGDRHGEPYAFTDVMGLFRPDTERRLTRLKPPAGDNPGSQIQDLFRVKISGYEQAGISAAVEIGVA